MALSICTRCTRHVRVGTACPFCGASAGAPIGHRISAANITSRAAFVFAAALASAACESESDPTSPVGEVDSGVDPLIDSGVPDSGPPDATALDAGYGAPAPPPEDAGADSGDAGPTSDGG